MTKKTKAKPSQYDIEIGARIKSLRLASGKTQSDIGKVLDVTFQQVQKIERGVNRISAGKVYELSCALGWSYDDIFPCKKV